MKLKNIDALMTIRNSSDHLFDADYRLDVLTLYKIRKNIQSLEEAYKPCSMTIDDIIKNKGDKTDAEIQAEIDKLMAQEIDVDIEVIPVSCFEGVHATPAFVNSIFYMLG